jgi:hypothetical protein
VKFDVQIPSAHYSSTHSLFGDELRYDGPMTTPLPGDVPNTSVLELGKDYDFSHSSLDSVGATAISECSPTNPHATVSTGLAEIAREGFRFLPSVRGWQGRARDFLKLGGSSYLAKEFGWDPFIGEIREVSKSISDSGTILSQYSRDSGRDVRRRFDFPATYSIQTKEYTSINEPNIGGGTTNLFRDPFRQEPKLIRTVETVDRQWFSGCFTYAAADKSTAYRRLTGAGSQADILLGTSLTPDVLWELTPWSWAIDWFSNTGDVINNITNFGQYGLVMRYGYMMHETVAKYTYRMDGPALYGQESPPPPAVVTITTKRRAQANPFGFGVGWEGLSPTQLAITAAVGITRLL